MCRACKTEAYGVEPDARKYLCESCGEKQVYGIEELLIIGEVKIVEDDKESKVLFEYTAGTDPDGFTAQTFKGVDLASGPDKSITYADIFDRNRTDKKVDELRAEWEKKPPRKKEED